MSDSQPISNTPAPPGNNAARHVRPDTEDAMRPFRDLALGLLNEMHLADVSSADGNDWNTPEMQQAAIKLQECLMWIELYHAVR